MKKIEDMDFSLGYLMDFGGHGIQSVYGLVQGYTHEDVELHNKTYEAALMDGLDNLCSVGQWGSFYLDGLNVVTFLGQIVGLAQIKGKKLTFTRPNGHVFEGKVPNPEEETIFEFERIK